MLVTLDMETYYDPVYSLKKLTTEEYIRDSRFKVHGVGVKVDGTTAVYAWTNIDVFLRQIDWSKAFVLCHNTRFDGAILSWRYGIRPYFLLDTMSMARAVFPHESSSLANLSKLCDLGEKGNELVNTMGVRDLTDAQQVALGDYCINDVDLTYALFQTMKVNFPVSELRVIDQTLRMFTESVLVLDKGILAEHLSKVQAKQAKLRAGRDLTSLRSNPQFAKLLMELGVDPPMKVSARTKKATFAFAKTDEGMLALLEHENEEVQTLAAARLGVKSSIEESRTKAFLGIAERGALPIPLNYFGAQNTGRFAGSDGINMQNLPKGGPLRKSIVASKGYVIIVGDFAQIEARKLAYTARQEDLVEQFRIGVDIYCVFASRVYAREITKENDPKARAVGKASILGLGYGMGWRKAVAWFLSGPLGMPPIIFTKADLDAMGGYLMKLDTKGITTKLTGLPLQIHCSAVKHIVDSYRQTYTKIPGYWKTCEKILSAMHRGVRHQFGALTTSQDKLWLPNGLALSYKDLRKDEDNDKWSYLGRHKERQHIYGSKLCENIIQALSRIVMTDAMLKVGERYKVAMTVHDELVCVVREEEAEEAGAFIETAMSQSPAWAPGIPIACEWSTGRSYGECK